MADENPLVSAMRRLLGIPSNAKNVEALINRSCDVDSDRLLDGFLDQHGGTYHGNLDLKQSEIGRQIIALGDAAQLRLLLRTAARVTSFPVGKQNNSNDIFQLFVLKKLISYLLRRPLPYEPEDLRLLIAAVQDGVSWGFPFRGLMNVLVKYSANHNGLPEAVREALRHLRGNLRRHRNDRQKEEVAEAIDDLLGEADAPAPTTITPGEAWSDTAIADLAKMTPQKRAAWMDLLIHAQSADGTRPTKKWLATAAQKVAAVGESDFQHHVASWLSLLEKSRTTQLPPPATRWEADKNHLFVETNADLIKGLIWCCTPMSDAALIRALGDAAIAGFKKVYNHGPRSVKIANAAVVALTAMPGNESAAQLGRLATQVKHPSARKYVAKALSNISNRTGQSPDELAELAIPTYGLDADGLLRRAFGDFTAELAIVGSTDAAIRWRRADGKLQKSIPADVKRDHADAIKELSRTVKDIGKMLPAQRVRIERLFMSDRSWPLDDWRQRYLDHPLLSNLSRRLIWEFITRDSTATPAGWVDGKLIDADDRPIETNQQTRVRLWHPLRSPPEVVLAWRQWLERHQISQPFKQAHREIYVLTDAERTTNTYSNRFAAHILRQHQFAALAQTRGWLYRLQGNFDSHNTPTLRLPEQDLRVEYWMEGAIEDATSESGIFLHVATDQVRFHTLDDPDPMRLEDVRPMLFSEIMRDVDLFVGVASIGNDPAWQDTGDEHRHGRYWQQYSFGDLSASATTRKAVLECIIPRLKIAARCEITDKFLKVRGDLRTYKIHLGSGNIMMEPNDQYLCIVPSRSAASRYEPSFLPFEGDHTLAVIISKAFLLADDRKITDETITRQIKAR